MNSLLPAGIDAWLANPENFKVSTWEEIELSRAAYRAEHVSAVDTIPLEPALVSVHTDNLTRCDDETCPQPHATRRDVPRAVRDACEVEILRHPQGFVAVVRARATSDRGVRACPPDACTMRRWVDDFLASSKLDLWRTGPRRASGEFGQWSYRYELTLKFV